MLSWWRAKQYPAELEMKCHIGPRSESWVKRKANTVPPLWRVRPSSLSLICSPCKVVFGLQIWRLWVALRTWALLFSRCSCPAVGFVQAAEQPLAISCGLCWRYFRTSWNKDKSSFQAPCNGVFSSWDKAVSLCKTCWLLYGAVHCGWHLLLCYWESVRWWHLPDVSELHLPAGCRWNYMPDFASLIVCFRVRFSWVTPFRYDTRMVGEEKKFASWTFTFFPLCYTDESLGIFFFLWIT